MIYLLHFDRPYKHARHYTGWTPDGNLDARLAAHKAGRGARLTQVVAQAGIGWTLARTWPGDRTRERQLKRQGGASRRCPICHPPKRHRWRELVTDAWFWADQAWRRDAEAVALGYATELAEYAAEHPRPQLRAFMVELSPNQHTDTTDHNTDTTDPASTGRIIRQETAA